MTFDKYARLLTLEAQRHMALAALAEADAVKAAHCQVAEAMMAGAILIRREVARRWSDCPRSERKRHLCLRPLRPDCPRGSAGR